MSKLFFLIVASLYTYSKKAYVLNPQTSQPYPTNIKQNVNFVSILPTFGVYMCASPSMAPFSVIPRTKKISKTM